MRYFVTVALAALALAVVAVHGWGGATAVHEHSEWETLPPGGVVASDFNENAADMAIARTWAENCRDNGWVGADCLRPKVPYVDEGVDRAAAADFDATGTTVEFSEGTGGFVVYRYARRPHPAEGEGGATATPSAGTGSGTAAGPSSICPVACLNGVDQGIDCQNMCTFGGERPFVLVCRPGVTYYRIDGGALQWTSGSVAGLRALHGDRFELAEECHGP